MATWVTPAAVSQSANSSSAAVMVPKVRTDAPAAPSGPIRRTQATTVALCTSRPAQQRWTRSMGVLRERGPGPGRPRGWQSSFLFVLAGPGGPAATGSGSIESSRGPARFVHGFEAPDTRRPQPRGPVSTTIRPTDAIFMGSGAASEEHDHSFGGVRAGPSLGSFGEVGAGRR